MMKKNRRQKNWQFLRKKEIDKFLIPKQPPPSTGISNDKNVINAFFNTLNVQARLDTTQDNAHLGTALSVIRQMVDIMDKTGCNDLGSVVKYYIDSIS